MLILYRVNEDASKEIKDKFFERMKGELDEGIHLLVMGNLNGRVGNQNTGLVSKENWRSVKNVKVMTGGSWE